MTTSEGENEDPEAAGLHVKVFSLKRIEVDGYNASVSDVRNQDEREEEEEEEKNIKYDDIEAPPDYARKQRLCCPLTRLPFEDPVVSKKDGVTFEKEALAQIGETSSYSNRSLIEYLDPLTNPINELQSFNKDKIGIFFCPITCRLMRDPVIDCSGNTYERGAIVDWIQEHGASPITRKPLHISQLYDNTTLFRVLYREIQQADKEIANSDEIRAWKQDVASFNYLTNAIKPASSDPSDRTLEARHPARMRVDYNGRWRNRNKNTVTLIGLLLVCLCVAVFLLLEFPAVAIWCLTALLVVGLMLVLCKLYHGQPAEN